MLVNPNCVHYFFWKQMKSRGNQCANNVRADCHNGPACPASLSVPKRAKIHFGKLCLY